MPVTLLSFKILSVIERIPPLLVKFFVVFKIDGDICDMAYNIALNVSVTLLKIRK